MPKLNSKVAKAQAKAEAADFALFDFFRRVECAGVLPKGKKTNARYDKFFDLLDAAEVAALNLFVVEMTESDSEPKRKKRR